MATVAVSHQELLDQALLGHSSICQHDQPGLILPESTGAPGELLESLPNSHLPRLSKMGAKSWSNEVVHMVCTAGQQVG